MKRSYNEPGPAGAQGLCRGGNEGRRERGNEGRRRTRRLGPASKRAVVADGLPLFLGMMPYEKYEAWKASHALALQVYGSTDKWPTREHYGLTAQTRRAALSVPTNIAEGAAKLGPREFRRYLDISLGSLSELSYLLRFSRDRGVLDIEEWQRLDVMRNRAGQLVWQLYRWAQQKAKSSA